MFKQLRTIDRNAGGPLQDYLTEMFDLTVRFQTFNFKHSKQKAKLVQISGADCWDWKFAIPHLDA
jgi:hypothetical protein